MKKTLQQGALSIIIVLFNLSSLAHAGEHEDLYWSILSEINEPELFHATFEPELLSEEDELRYVVYSSHVNEAVAEKCWAKLSSHSVDNKYYSILMALPSAFKVSDKVNFRNQVLLKKRAKADAAMLLNNLGCEGVIASYIDSSNQLLDALFERNVEKYGVKKALSTISDSLFEWGNSLKNGGENNE